MIDEKIESLFKLAGNSNIYQYTLLLITSLIWINLHNLSVTVGFLEKLPDITYYDNNSGKFIESTLNSTICNWKDNYTITKKYSHSIVTSFGYDCNPLWIGFLGSSIFLGNLLGSFIFQYIVEKIGRKKNLVFSSIPYVTCMFIIIFTPDYINCLIFFFFSEIFCVNISLSAYLITSEVSSSENRSIFSTIINSGYGLCGIVYTILYKFIGNWRIVFSISLGSSILIILSLIIFSYESPRFYLEKKDFYTFIESLRKIAKTNKRLDLFDKEIKIQDSPYKEAFDHLKDYLINENKAKDTLRYSPDRNYLSSGCDTDEGTKYHVNNKKSINNKKDPGNKNIIKDDVKMCKENLSNFEDNLSSINIKINLFNNNKKCFSFLDFFKYASIRYKFLSLCFIWFTSSGTYYGLSINIKNLNGDFYINSIINYSFEILIYMISGWMTNLKFFGRKTTLGLFYLLANTGMIMYIFFQFEQTFTNFLLFTIRLCIAANYGIIYTYTLEVYPSPARARGFAINSLLSEFSSVIFPILIEILPGNVFYIFLMINLICLLLLLIILPETYGKLLRELIEEEDESLKKNKIFFSDQENPLIEDLNSL